MTGHGTERRAFWRSRTGLALIGFLVVAGYFLITEHRAHLAGALSYLPFVLLLLCPLLHFFHGHGDGHGNAEAKHQHDGEEK